MILMGADPRGVVIYFCFLLAGFSLTDTDDPQGIKGKEGIYSSTPLPLAHEYSDINLQLCV